jgi:hypothetical protein
MTINRILDNHWYRNPKGPRKGPWFSCEVSVDLKFVNHMETEGMKVILFPRSTR